MTPVLGTVQGISSCNSEPGVYYLKMGTLGRWEGSLGYDERENVLFWNKDQFKD
jgi:hypothetical protein